MRNPGVALPLMPLLHAHVAAGVPSPGVLHQLPGLGSRFSAILGATARFLYTDFLDRATDDAARDAFVRFYEAVVTLPLHTATLRKRAGFARHAVSAILHGQASAADKLESCLCATGAYRIPGLGPAFFSALTQALTPARLPGWTPLTLSGLQRLGLLKPTPGATPASIYSALIEGHARIRAVRRELSALHVDHFLALVAVMPGRNLSEAIPELARCPVKPTVDRQRAKVPLRERLKARGQAVADAQQTLAAALRERDGKKLGDALAGADPAGAARCHLDWGACAEVLLAWVGRLWDIDDPYTLLSEFWRTDALPGAGLWLPCAVLHLRDPMRFAPYNDTLRAAHALLDDGLGLGDPPAERYRLFNEAVDWLRERFSLHPMEVPDVLAALAGEDGRSGEPSRTSECRSDGFRGFCDDTFTFLGELAASNRRAWMEPQRPRYRFAVRAPMVELCRALATRYIEPVLNGRHGWDLDTAAQSGRALTSVAKNAFGRGEPYNTALWITFCKTGAARAGAQLFVRLSASGLRWGVRLGRGAAADRDRLRDAMERNGEAIFSTMQEHGALERLAFGPADQPEAAQVLTSADDLLVWARGRSQEASWSRPANDALLMGEELVGEILLGFDRLLPLFAPCLEGDAITPPISGESYPEGDFLAQTSLGGDWLRRSLQLLSLKKQLILQGVPGTGKTHVARCLARLISGGVGDAVRLVQFHPAYSYEEFVEGIRVKSVAVEGRHDVTYPVEDGLLCAFAAQAAARPAQPHVLVIDEINRGNLPRIFGELLYLLEYRGQAVELPCSRRSFRLPENLTIVATMNAADRSIAALDQALRRRFSFVEMEPDSSVLAAWLRAHPPVSAGFAERVLSAFERLNTRLQSESGPQARVGHSYFMVDGLDEERLRMIWRHHVRPLVEEHFAAQPGRATAYDAIFEPGAARGRRAETTPS